MKKKAILSLAVVASLIIFNTKVQQTFAGSYFPIEAKELPSIKYRVQEVVTHLPYY